MRCFGVHGTPRVCCQSTAASKKPKPALAAVRRSLAGLPLHRSEGGLLIAPVLQPQADNIPFGLALTLHSQAQTRQQAVLPCEEDLYELQYVLEGKGELRSTSGRVQDIAAGDSALAPSGRAWCQSTDPGNEPELAVLTLLVPGSLPVESNQQESGLVDRASHAMETWMQHPVVGLLPEHTVNNLLQHAKAQAAHAEDTWQHFQSNISSMAGLRHADTAKLDTRLPENGDARHTTHNDATASGRQESVWLPAHWRGYRMLVPQSQKVFQKFVSSTQKLLSNHVVQWLWPDQCVMKKTLSELNAFQLPNQTNRLALMFDPTDHEVPFTFGVEIFEQGHKTKPHTHAVSHELFFILAGEGTGFCDSEHFPVKAGDVVVFPPTSLHGIDNGPDSKMYCLELMLPNDMFAEFVKQGQPAGTLRDDDMCIMVAQGCSSA